MEINWSIWAGVLGGILISLIGYLGIRANNRASKNTAEIASHSTELARHLGRIALLESQIVERDKVIDGKDQELYEAKLAIVDERQQKHDERDKAQLATVQKAIADLHHEQEMHRKDLEHAEEIHALVLTHDRVVAEHKAAVLLLQQEVEQLKKERAQDCERFNRLEAALVAAGVAVPT